MQQDERQTEALKGFSLETEHRAALSRLVAAVEGINKAVRYAVEAGLSVEVVRACRHHDGTGNWGDQMSVRPLVRTSEDVRQHNEV